MIQKKLPHYVNAKELELQVLTPMRKGLLGVERLNNILQEYLNPPSPSKKEKEVPSGLFREGDKVMQTKNNYQMEWEWKGLNGIILEKGMGVFNGDTGIICEINEFAETMCVEFDENKFVTYTFKQLEELELAYAITILHSSFFTDPLFPHLLIHKYIPLIQNIVIVPFDCPPYYKKYLGFQLNIHIFSPL